MDMDQARARLLRERQRLLEVEPSLEAEDPLRPGFLSALKERRPFTIDILYGDQEGGQRTISRFTLMPASDEGWYCQAGRHWNLDRPDPR